MIIFTILVTLAVLSITFAAGARYGRVAEAKAIALAIRIEAYGDAEYRLVLLKLRNAVSQELNRIKTWL